MCCRWRWNWKALERICEHRPHRICSVALETVGCGSVIFAMSSSESDEDLLCASAGFLVVHSLLSKNKKRRRRRWWMTTPFKNRSSYSATNLMDELRNDDAGHFKNFCRMTPENFDQLLNLVAPKIEKKNTNYRQAIPAKERLAITLHYLATGNSFTSLAYTFKVSKQLISSIIPEVCLAIIESLKEYIKVSLLVLLTKFYPAKIELKYHLFRYLFVKLKKVVDIENQMMNHQWMSRAVSYWLRQILDQALKNVLVRRQGWLVMMHPSKMFVFPVLSGAHN